MVVSSVRRHLDPAVPALAARGAAADRAAQGRPSLWRTPATVHQPDHRNAVLGAARANPHAVPHAVRGLGAARNFSRLEIAATRRHRHAVEPGRDPPWWRYAAGSRVAGPGVLAQSALPVVADRKSTRLNSSH